ncbi:MULTISPECIES: hypothetical protein [unclassified Marinitoga]|uniref:hypothetical protein n=1 Tax=unclassified Marinitoga TaxID=2640159 RepID=UPI0006417BA4|nr:MULTISPECIES: hypothetical protein [unclassified Marinitoga]KLO23936.1 hypothetical protein X274_05535 [Marinitoga sp. 1155]NUU99166.1 hypothetical protein [Marinitoga sp. 1154]
MNKIDRKYLPYVETEGTVKCFYCGESYIIDKQQKLHTIIITECPYCGRQNINIVTNSIKYIDEVLDKIEKLKIELLSLKESLKIEMQEKGCVDNYPEIYMKKNNDPKLI